jgi:cobalt-precorrin-5B (C1)-methyltransferase
VTHSNKQLRKGWTTGACATAAVKSAFTALITGSFPDPIAITLPRGEKPFFNLAKNELGGDYALACVVKDAGDDPDVTHGALICARVRRLAAGKGVVFRAGNGVGTVTKAGLQLAVGEPAINPVPREMMRSAIAEIAALHKVPGDVEIEISVPGGEKIALKTMNPRLGILGGISILGTTGIVIPFSCSAWIHSIYRGIDVARAEGLTHIAGATGSTSEDAIRKIYNFPESALIDMGDFVGGMLKYLRKHPVEKVTIAGGFAKMTKLAQGLLDLHSRAGDIDLGFLAETAENEQAPPDIALQIKNANSARHAFEIAKASTPGLADAVARLAWQTAAKTLEGTGIFLEIVIFNREGELLAGTGFKRT